MSDFILPTAPNYENAMLLAKSVTMRFGGVTAVSDLSIALPKGGIAGIIGPNGAGKTTAFNVLSGFYTPQEGEVIFNGKSVKGTHPSEICRLGMARTFQNIRLSQQMTVLENIMVGCHVRRHCPWWMAPLGLPSFYKEEAAIVEKSKQLAERVNLSANLNDQAGSLPYGAQRRLEIARALATEPRLLLLDEPAAGMKAAIRQRADRPTAFLLSRVNPFLFPGGQPYGYDSLGTPGNLNKFTPKDVRGFWQKQLAQPWVLSVAGDFDREAVLAFARSLPAPDGKGVLVPSPSWSDARSLDLHLPGRNQAHGLPHPRARQHL